MAFFKSLFCLIGSLPLLSCHFHFRETAFFIPSLSIYVPFALKWVSCRQHIIGSCFLTPNAFVDRTGFCLLRAATDRWLERTQELKSFPSLTVKNIKIALYTKDLLRLPSSDRITLVIAHFCFVLFFHTARPGNSRTFIENHMPLGVTIVRC